VRVIALSPEASEALGVPFWRWAWAVDCRQLHVTIAALRCEQMVLNGKWMLPRVFA
jgi:hypothetical protein